MATLHSLDIAKSEQFNSKTDKSLIEGVQERSRLLKTVTDTHNPVIRAGDRSLAELLRRYQRWIWKQVYAFTGIDPDDAYSNALQGFQRAIEKFDLSRGYSLVSFASVVVRRAIQRLLNREQTESEKAEMAAEVVPLYHEDEFIDPYEQEQREQQIEALNSEIGQLKPTPQKIIEMRDAGMKFREIGAFFSKSAGAVRMDYNRAKASLKAQLQSEPLEPPLQIQPQLTLQTADVEPATEIAELTATPSVPKPEVEPTTKVEPTPSDPIAEVENSTVPASSAVSETGWMGRFWLRFCKSVRFLKSGAISNSPTIFPVGNQDALVSDRDSALRASPLQRLASIKIWRFFDE
jgi:RNA polymerase sigma factor (sigma-70 family)